VTIKSENSKTLSSPPFFVNTRSSTSGNGLFVNSDMLAKNDHKDAFKSGSVIDVYDLQTGMYHFSFYIYHYWNTKRMIEFRVAGNKLVVLYDRLIRVFDFVPQYFGQENLEYVAKR